MRIRHLLPAVGMLCLVIAGCTIESPGEPTTAPTEDTGSTGSAPTSSGDDDLPASGAPKVDNPLENTARFEQDPCSILTADQAENLGLPRDGKEEESVLGLDCQWFNKESRGQVTIGFLTNNRNGLSAAYAAKARGELAYLDELQPVEGFPAIASDLEDRRPKGICLVTVGVTDRLAFHVDVHLSTANVGAKDPCETGTKVATQALRTMKEGA